MADIFLIFNIFLIVLSAILIWRNKSWKSQPIVLVMFALVLVVFGLTLIFS